MFILDSQESWICILNQHSDTTAIQSCQLLSSWSFCCGKIKLINSVRLTDDFMLPTSQNAKMFVPGILYKYSFSKISKEKGNYFKNIKKYVSSTS